MLLKILPPEHEDFGGDSEFEVRNMAFDIYNLIQSKEVREYLREHRKFKVLEQEVIIRNSYYTIEEKLEFLKQLLVETRDDMTVDKSDMELLEDKIWVDYNDRQIDIISLTYPQLDMCDHFLSYDWIERAEGIRE